MSLSIFNQKGKLPNQEMLENAIGSRILYWNELIKWMDQNDAIHGEWKFYSQKSGWSFLLKEGKRALLYLIPQDQFFKVNFVLRERAVGEAMASQIPEGIKDLIAKAPPYREGRSFMFDIKDGVDLEVAKALLEIKQKG